MRNNFEKIFGLEARTKYFIPVLACLCFVSILFFSLLFIGGRALGKKEKNAVVEKSDQFQSVNIEAKAAFVWDVINHKELFSKNADNPLPLASLTKIMTAVTTDGKLNDDQQIKITKEDLAPEGDSGLLVGDTWKARDLRDFTLLTSSNDGAFALAAVVKIESPGNPPYKIDSATTSTQAEFVKAMNETASKIGLLNSRFFNENGLDISEDRGGAYGSAKDIAVLFEYTLKNYPEILEATRYKSLEFSSTEKKYSAENTNIVIDKIPNVIASKTGYTDLAGGNLVVAFDAGLGRPIIISVLGSSESGRFSDVLQLVQASMKFINTR